MTDPEPGRHSRTMRIDVLPSLLTPPRQKRAAPKTVRLRPRRPGEAGPAAQEAEHLGGPDFQELLQQSYDAALITDSMGSIAESNARAEEFLLCTREELLEKSLDGIISGWTPQLLATVQQTLESKRYVLLQAYCIRHDESLFPGEVAIIRLHVGGAKLFCFFIRDVTLRKQAENRMRIGFNAIENAGDGILIADMDAVIEYANPAALTLWHKACEEELVGLKLRDLVEDPNAIDAAMQVVESKQTWSGELLARRDNHEDFHIRVSAAPNIDEDNQWLGVVLSVQDITQRKRTESRLRKTFEALTQSNADLQEFAYVASHDLQEPLRKITVFGDLLRRRAEGALDPEAAGHLMQIEKAAHRMSALIQGILELSRVSTHGRGFTSVDLSLTVQDVIADLELRIRETGATIEVGTLPVIEAESIQIQQLFQNLILNALKFRRRDAVPSLRIYAREQLPRPDRSSIPHYEIVVEDNGIGFDPAHAERIFGIFQRLHSREEYDGTGIGLAVCRKIARRHGGDIRAESREGDGARFIVTLPAHQAPAQDVTG